MRAGRRRRPLAPLAPLAPLSLELFGAPRRARACVGGQCPRDTRTRGADKAARGDAECFAPPLSTPLTHSRPRHTEENKEKRGRGKWNFTKSLLTMPCECFLCHPCLPLPRCFSLLLGQRAAQLLGCCPVHSQCNACGVVCCREGPAL